jgi:hypothetical protein
MKHRRTAQEKKLADDARLLRAWRAFHREEKAAALAGPYSATLVELFRMFSNLECVKPAQLIGLIGAVNWSSIDYSARCVVLHEVSTSIAKHRERQGLPVIDDPLPGQPDNAFRIIRKIITEFPASPQERPAPRGPDPVTDHQ